MNELQVMNPITENNYIAERKRIFRRRLKRREKKINQLKRKQNAILERRGSNSTTGHRIYRSRGFNKKGMIPLEFLIENGKDKPQRSLSPASDVNEPWPLSVLCSLQANSTRKVLLDDLDRCNHLLKVCNHLCSL